MERPRNTELVMDPHVAQWFVRATTRLLASYAIIVGVTILVGGEGRFAGLSYKVANETPGAPESWGWTICIAGAVMFVGSFLGHPRIIGLGAILGCVWALLFAWAFSVAAVRYSDANTTAMWAYGLLFLVFALIAGVHFAMHPIRLRRRRNQKD